MELSNIPYQVSRRAVRYPRLEFKTGQLLIILPFNHEPDVILDKHKDWILKKINFIKGCLEGAKDKELIDRSEEDFKDVVHSLAKKTSEELGVKLNYVYFRKMRTKWASLSSLKNLTVNRLMKYLPEHLIRYVIFHEIAHLIEKRHNDKFWHIISRKYEGYREMEREMFTYWFLVSKEYQQI